MIIEISKYIANGQDKELLMNNHKENIKKNSKLMNKILVFVMSIILIAAVALIIITIDLSIRYHQDKTLGNLLPYFSFNGKSINNQETFLSLLPSIISTLCWIVLIEIVLFKLTRVFSTINTENTPFSTKVLNHLKQIFIILLISSFLPNVIESLLVMNLMVIGDTSLVNGGSLIVALITFSLVKIFDYGVSLQIENDQTL